MIFRRSNQQAREAFLKRFDEYADGCLFRPTPTAAPVRVTEGERDEELAAFLRGARWLSWGLVGGLIAAVAGLVILDPNATADRSDLLMWGIIVPIVGAYAGGWWWLWRSPVRRFERRAVAGASRTRAEARRVALDGLSWRQLGVALVFAALLMARYFDGELVWASIGALLTLLVAIQAGRKYSSHRHDGKAQD